MMIKNNHLKLNYKRKIGVGIDLSEVANESFKPAKDVSKVNNSMISDKDRSNAFVNTKNTDLLSKRYANISTNYDFMKSYDDQPSNANKRRLSLENIKNENTSEYENKSIQQKPYEFGLEYYSTDGNKYSQEDYLDRISRKKPIGPHHNSVSANFVLPTVSK